MEHRTDLEQILLSGLPAAEQDHVVKVIGETRAAKLNRLRAENALEIVRETKRSQTASEQADVDEDLHAMDDV